MKLYGTVTFITHDKQEKTVMFTVSDIYKDEITVHFDRPLDETERHLLLSTPHYQVRQEGEETEQNTEQPQTYLNLTQMIFYQDESRQEEYKGDFPEGLNASIYQALKEGVESVQVSTQKDASQPGLETTSATSKLSENNHFKLKALEQFFTDLKETLVNDPKTPQARWGLAGLILLGAGFVALIAGGPIGIAVGSVLVGIGIACLARAYYLGEIAHHSQPDQNRDSDTLKTSRFNVGATLFKQEGKDIEEGDISSSSQPRLGANDAD